MKIMHVVGNRPQFIKLAPVSRELHRRNIDEVIIHTGQHYDENMSDIFFKELGIQAPGENLYIGSATHTQMTAKAMLGLEKNMLKYKPSCVIVYGDTDSTLAATLVASKLLIPLVHVEAGPRTYNSTNPEECNRIVVDHLSDYLCAPDKESEKNLIGEGICPKKIFLTGDVMYDEFLYCASESYGNYLNNLPKEFVLLTWHRQENTSDKKRMEQIISFLEQVNYPIVFPAHPRTKKMLEQFGLMERIKNIHNVKVINPVGYKEMVVLLDNCKILVSDSGGASKEAAFCGKKCLYMLDLVIWRELTECGFIQNIDFDDHDSVKSALSLVNNISYVEDKLDVTQVFGDGYAAAKIADIIEEYIN